MLKRLRFVSLIAVLTAIMLVAVPALAQEETPEPTEPGDVPVEATEPVDIPVEVTQPVVGPIDETPPADDAPEDAPAQQEEPAQQPEATEPPAPADSYDLDGDGVNIDFPDVHPFDTNAYIRFAHLAPGVGDVDIYINGELMEGLSGVGYEELGEWMALEPGGYDIEVTAAGDDVANASVTIDSFQLARGQWITAATVLDNQDTPAIVTAVENFTEPLPGVTNVTFLNALSMDNDVTFYRNGVPYVANLGQMASDINSYSYAIPVDTGTYGFSATVEFDDEVIASTEEEFELTEWSSTLIAVYGDEENNAQLLIDETTLSESAVLRDWLPENGTIVDALANNEALQPHVRSIDLAGLTETLSGEGPFTVFIPAGFLADEMLVAADDDTEALAGMLEAHVYEGEILYSGDLIERDSLVMANGNEIPVTVDGNGIFVGGARVIDVNIPATNGIIHVIGYVIDPTLDQEDYDLFDDAVNLQNSVDPDVTNELEQNVDDMDTEGEGTEGEGTDNQNNDG